MLGERLLLSGRCIGVSKGRSLLFDMSRGTVHVLIPLAEEFLGESESVLQGGDLAIGLSPLEPVEDPIRLWSFGRGESLVDGMRRVDQCSDVRDDLRFRPEIEETFRRRDPAVVPAQLVREKGVVVLLVLVEVILVGASVVSPMDLDIALRVAIDLPELLPKTSRVRGRSSSHQGLLHSPVHLELIIVLPRLEHPVCLRRSTLGHLPHPPQHLRRCRGALRESLGTEREESTQILVKRNRHLFEGWRGGVVVLG